MQGLGTHSHPAPAGGARPFVLQPGPVPQHAPRQRAKLWELNGSVHCSVIGTCLTPGELRRVMGRAARADLARLTDHDLHAEAVGLCGGHGACAKLLQKALDRRHEAAVKQFARLHGEAAVLEAWRAARAGGAIPGAYWAALTHPDLGHEGMRRIFGDVHMLSHLIGAANRADIQRLTALEAENAALLAKVGRQQQRIQDAVAARDAAARRLASVAADAAALVSPGDASLGNASPGDPSPGDPSPGETAAALRHAVADLQGRLAGETGRRERLERRVADLAGAAQARERRLQEAEADRAALRRELALLDRQDDAAPRLRLPAQTVLYVGGRPGCVEQMRALLEAEGGALLCHDGGRHDHPSLLPGLIGQAEWVAFPVDCVSHDAALTVKRLCRRLGKRWSPLRSSGVASFLAAAASPAEHGACCGHGAGQPVMAS